MELCLTLFIRWAEIKPKTHPKTMAPRVNQKNNRMINIGGGGLPLTNYKLIVNRIIHVPSLNKLYPSINELNFRGAPAYFNKAKTATVSVHERTDPNIKASGHVYQLSSYWMIALIENIMKEAPTSTAGNAKIKICVACFLNMYQSELNPLSNIKGGKNINKIPLGSIVDIV